MRISSAAFLEFQGGAMWQRPHGTPSNVPLDFIEGIGEVSLASPISTKLRPRLKWKMIQLMSLTSAVRGSFKGMGWGSSTLEFRYFNSYAFLKFDWIFRIRMEYLELVLLYLRTKKIRYNWFSRYIILSTFFKTCFLSMIHYLDELIFSSPLHPPLPSEGTRHVHAFVTPWAFRTRLYIIKYLLCIHRFAWAAYTT